MTRRVRLGTDLGLVNEWNTVHLLEALSPAVRASTRRERGRAAKTRDWMAVGPQLFELAPVDDCDVAVLPFAWEDVDGVETAPAPHRRGDAERFAALAAGHGRPLLVFHQEDWWAEVPLPEAIVFRQSMYRSTAGERDILMPGWVLDPLETGLPTISPRPYRSPPSVGFCGFAALPDRDAPLTSRAEAFARSRVRRLRCALGLDDRRGRQPPVHLRSDAVRALMRATAVLPDVVVRSEPMSIVEPPEGSRPGDDERRREYLDALARNDYVLAVRGRGNYSGRMYEAMAAGRVPVFVDTDSPLPWPGTIDWDALVVRVDQRDIRRLGRVVRAAHDRMSPEEFASRQASCRETWDRHLRMSAYFTQVHDRIVAALEAGPLLGPPGRQRLLAELHR